MLEPWFWKIKTSGGSIYIPAEVENPVIEYEIKEEFDPFNDAHTDYLDIEKRIRVMIELMERPPRKANYAYIYSLAEDLWYDTGDFRLLEPMEIFKEKFKK